MSITIKEMLDDKYFQGFKLIAGERGLGRLIHAATVFDSPDGYKWFKGKEFVLSTGYLFLNNTQLFSEVILFLKKHNAAGLGIKTDRYLKDIPEEIIELANEIDFPIIEVPYDEPWVDLISRINAIAINRFISSMIETVLLKDIPLRPFNLKKKVDEILICLFEDIQKPLSVLNLLDKTNFTFPSNYQPDEKYIHFQPAEDYDFSYRQDILFDKPNINDLPMSLVQRTILGSLYRLR